MSRRNVLIAALVAVLPLAACRRAEPSGATVAAVAPAPAVTPSDLRAAAELYENLTESAFAVAPAQLGDATAAAKAAAESAKTGLPTAAQVDLERRLQAIDAARVADDRAAVALAAVEVYRLFVDHAPAPGQPSEVALLDYAGFRYAADLKASPVRWFDAVDAAAFAQARWTAIEARVADGSLRARVDAALADMTRAAAAQNAALGAAAVQRELDLVDALEGYFARR